MSKFNYYKEQFKRLETSTEYIQFKLHGNNGDTNWIALNDESIDELIKYLQAKQNKPKPINHNNRTTTGNRMLIGELIKYQGDLPVYLRLYDSQQEFSIDDVFSLIENNENGKVIIETWQNVEFSETQKQRLMDCFNLYKGMRCFNRKDYLQSILYIIHNETPKG